MEWVSPWGRGAPGWHLECSTMSLKYLGEQFDIHTGGIDHREIHHPNEIAQNANVSRKLCRRLWSRALRDEASNLQLYGSFQHCH